MQLIQFSDGTDHITRFCFLFLAWRHGRPPRSRETALIMSRAQRFPGADPLGRPWSALSSSCVSAHLPASARRFALPRSDLLAYRAGVSKALPFHEGVAFSHSLCRVECALARAHQ